MKMQQNLLKLVEELGESLPPNTLDQLIDELGGSTEVAEVRKGTVIFKCYIITTPSYMSSSPGSIKRVQILLTGGMSCACALRYGQEPVQLKKGP
jgi:hypothetical protein